MYFLLTLIVNALAAVLVVPPVSRVLHRRPNVDGKALAMVILFVVFGALYLLNNLLLKWDAAALCRG